MKNPATARSDQLNEFTQQVKEFSSQVCVRMRDGTHVFPEFVEAEDEHCSDAFFTKNYSHCWNLDGTSVTRPDYDMMEIIST